MWIRDIGGELINLNLASRILIGPVEDTDQSLWSVFVWLGTKPDSKVTLVAGTEQECREYLGKLSNNLHVI